MRPDPIHLDDEQIQRVLDDQLEASAHERVTGHLAICAECRLRLDQATAENRWVFERLRRADSPEPLVSPESVVRQARRRTLIARLQAAAVLLALGAAGVASALPGSPLRAWIDRVVRKPVESPVAPPPTAPVDTTAVPTGGIAIAPGERAVIRFTAVQTRGTALVDLVDDPNLAIRAFDEKASFTTDQGLVIVENPGSTASYQIEVPRRAPRVEIRVAGRVVFHKTGDRIVTDAPLDARGRYRLHLTPAGR